MPEPTLSDLHVLVPDEFGGLVVCPLHQVVEAFMEDKTLAFVLEECSIDMVPATPVAVARVRRLNETGDAAAYWNPGA
jgi:hypothetical protein